MTSNAGQPAGSAAHCNPASHSCDAGAGRQADPVHRSGLSPLASIALAAALVAVLGIAGALAARPVQSGPQGVLVVTATPSSAPPASPAAAPASPRNTFTPANPPAAATSWPPARCDWASKGLAEDAQLDRAAAGRPDPRYPGMTPAAWSAYYTQLAGQWDAIAQLVAVKCGRTSAGAAPSCDLATSWLAQGALAHDADLNRAGATAADAQWNAAWAAFYRNLAAELGPC